MADTTALKNRIRAAIKANDNQEITGPVLQQALLDMVDELNGVTEIEAQQRQSGDSTLQQAITTEKNRAEGVELTLQQNIAAEKNRAEGVELTLQQNIAAEKNRAEGAESTLHNTIYDVVYGAPDLLVDSFTVNTTAETQCRTTLWRNDNSPLLAETKLYIRCHKTDGDEVDEWRIQYLNSEGDGIGYSDYSTIFDEWVEVETPNAIAYRILSNIVATKVLATGSLVWDIRKKIAKGIDDKIDGVKQIANENSAAITGLGISKQDKLVIGTNLDNTIIDDSINPVTSGAVYSTLTGITKLVNNIGLSTTSGSQCKGLIWKDANNPLAAKTKIQVRCSKTSNAVSAWRIQFTDVDAQESIAYSDYITMFGEFVEIIIPNQSIYRIQCNIQSQYVTGNGSVTFDIQIIDNDAITPKIDKIVRDISTLHDDVSNISDEVDGLQVEVNGGSCLGERISGWLINSSSNKWKIDAYGAYYIIPIVRGDTIKITANSNYTSQVCVLKSYTQPEEENESPDYATGWSGISTINMDSTQSYVAPSDGNYLYILYSRTDASTITMPTRIEINGQDASNMESLRKQISGKQNLLVEGQNMDNYPTEGSDNPISSNGVFNALSYVNGKLYPEYVGRINNSGIWQMNGSDANSRCFVFSINETDTIKIKPNSVKNTQYTFLSAFPSMVHGTPAPIIEIVVGTKINTITAGSTLTTLTVPSGAKFMYILSIYNSSDFLPTEVEVNGRNAFSLQEQIKSLDERVDNIEDVDSIPTKNSSKMVTSGGVYTAILEQSGLPDYVKSAAIDAFDRLMNWAEGDDIFKIVQITDTHVDSFPEVIPEIGYLSLLNSMFNFDMLLYSGDITFVNGVTTRKKLHDIMYNTVKGMNCTAPFIFTHGNHDGNPDTNVTVSLGEIGNVYNLPAARRFSNVVFGEESGKCYGYIDFPASKTRFIFLNTTENTTGGGFEFTVKQAQWLADSLVSTPAKYTVIIGSHICPYTPIKHSISQTSSVYISILEAFVTKTSGQNQAGTVVWDFTNVDEDTKLAYCIFGHEHFNNYAKNNGVNYIIRQGYANGTIDDGVIVDTTNLSMDTWNSTTQKRGEHCLFDIIAIKSNGTGKVVRIGVGGSTRDFEFTF